MVLTKSDKIQYGIMIGMAIVSLISIGSLRSKIHELKLQQTELLTKLNKE